MNDVYKGNKLLLGDREREGIKKRVIQILEKIIFNLFNSIIENIIN